MPLLTRISRVFSPTAHVTGEVVGDPLRYSPITEVLSSGVALMELVASVVAAVYSNTSGSNAGVRVREPIRSADRPAVKGL